MNGPRVFIIDDHADFRRLLGHHVTARWPDAAVQYYDPVISGRLPQAFSGAGSDVVLLGHPAAHGDALDWLRQLRRTPRFPPVVFLGSGDERQIVAAIKAGAVDYITRSGLSHPRLVEAIEQALAACQPGESARPRALEPAVSGLPGLPGYELVRTLSEGDVASVHLTRERATGRLAVLKVLRQVPDSGGEKHFDRFLQEYELIARVDHPNVVRIFDLGIADDHAYIAMEYCSRGSLKRRIAAGMSGEQAFASMQVMAAALGALHAVGIYHRDLKPTNVMFREDDSLVLIDFGLAKQAQFKAGITGTGAIFGTPYYMSPEQGEGNAVDQRSDIYSLGIVFYEMLTGRKPYDGPAAMSVIIQHRDAPLPRLPDPLAHFQPALDRMLAKDPAGRFQSIAEVLAWRPETGPAAASGKGH
ncbi:MAG: protein kinase [Gammaproteobacteria bacterium]|nr:protein kinase [Gammaproteobacteria bacterium]